MPFLELFISEVKKYALQNKNETLGKACFWHASVLMHQTTGGYVSSATSFIRKTLSKNHKLKIKTSFFCSTLLSSVNASTVMVWYPMARLSHFHSYGSSYTVCMSTPST